jgi:hypothetical protein
VPEPASLFDWGLWAMRRDEYTPRQYAYSNSAVIITDGGSSQYRSTLHSRQVIAMHANPRELPHQRFSGFIVRTHS